MNSTSYPFENGDNPNIRRVQDYNKIWSCWNLIDDGFVCTSNYFTPRCYIRNRSGTWRCLPQKYADLIELSSGPPHYSTLRRIYRKFIAQEEVPRATLPDTVSSQSSVLEFLSLASEDTNSQEDSPGVMKKQLSDNETTMLTNRLQTKKLHGSMPRNNMVWNTEDLLSTATNRLSNIQVNETLKYPASQIPIRRGTSNRNVSRRGRPFDRKNYERGSDRTNTDLVQALSGVFNVQRPVQSNRNYRTYLTLPGSSFEDKRESDPSEFQEFNEDNSSSEVVVKKTKKRRIKTPTQEINRKVERESYMLDTLGDRKETKIARNVSPKSFESTENVQPGTHVATEKPSHKVRSESAHNENLSQISSYPAHSNNSRSNAFQSKNRTRNVPYPTHSETDHKLLQMITTGSSSNTYPCEAIGSTVSVQKLLLTSVPDELEDQVKQSQATFKPRLGENQVVKDVVPGPPHRRGLCRSTEIPSQKTAETLEVYPSRKETSSALCDDVSTDQHTAYPNPNTIQSRSEAVSSTKNLKKTEEDKNKNVCPRGIKENSKFENQPGQRLQQQPTPNIGTESYVTLEKDLETYKNSLAMRGEESTRGQSPRSRNAFMNTVKRKEQEMVNLPSQNTRSRRPSIVNDPILDSGSELGNQNLLESRKEATCNDVAGEKHVKLSAQFKPDNVKHRQDYLVSLIAGLKTKLKENYNQQFIWLQEVPWLNDETTFKSCFQLSVQTRTSFSTVDATDLFHSDEKRILLRNEAKFGKTSLCAILAQQWTQNKSSKFELCIYVNLKTVEPGENLNEKVINNFHTSLDNQKVTRLELEEALLQISDKVLVLLDGLDATDVQSHKEVRKFLSAENIFAKSTIMVTSRPIQIEDSFLLLFEKHVQILGLDVPVLAKLVNTKGFEEFCKISKVYFLEGFPPQYIYGTLQVFKTCDPGNLYELLSNIFELSYKWNTCNEIITEDICSKLGEIFLLTLLNGSDVIEMESLKSAFSEDCLKLLMDIGIVLPVGAKLAFPKVLAVYFATWYLRHNWSNSNKSKNDHLLKKYFNCGGTIEDYVLGIVNERKPLVYLVGVLPEIVLQVKPDHESTFEMYYDTEAVEVSNAFDSVNLLIRVGDRVLHRFGFVRHSSETERETFENVFSDIIVCLDFDDCVVQQRYYSNEYEKRDFMTASIEQSEEKCPILQVIVVKNQATCPSSSWIQFEQLHLNFRFESYHTIGNFLKTILPRNGSEELSLSDSMNMGEFIFEILTVLSNIEASRAMHVGVSDKEPETCLKKTFSFDLKTDSHSKCQFWFIYQTVKSFEKVEKHYQLDTVLRNKLGLIQLINYFASTLNNPYITIYLK